MQHRADAPDLHAGPVELDLDFALARRQGRAPVQPLAQRRRPAGGDTPQALVGSLADVAGMFVGFGSFVQGTDELLAAGRPQVGQQAARGGLDRLLFGVERGRQHETFARPRGRHVEQALVFVGFALLLLGADELDQVGVVVLLGGPQRRDQHALVAGFRRER